MKNLNKFAVIIIAAAVLAGCTPTSTSTQSQTDTSTASETVSPSATRQDVIVEEATATPEKSDVDYSKYEGTTELKIENMQEGTGTTKTKTGDTVSVHYTGYLTNGTKFDSSVDRGTPFSFKLGSNRVIQGWEQGFLDKKVGDKFALVIPSTLGYGARANGEIPANSVLVFEVEVMDIQPGA